MWGILANAKTGDLRGTRLQTFFTGSRTQTHIFLYWLIGTSVFDQWRKIRMTMNVKQYFFLHQGCSAKNARLTDSQLHVGAIKAVPESAAGLLELKTLVGAETHLHKFVYGDTNLSIDFFYARLYLRICLHYILINSTIYK